MKPSHPYALIPLPKTNSKRPLKINGWKIKFPFAMAYFQGRTVSLREGMYLTHSVTTTRRFPIPHFPTPSDTVTPFRTHKETTAKKNLRSQGHVFSVITHHKPQIPIKSRELSPWISVARRSEWHLFFQKKPSGTLEMPVIPHIFDPSCLTLLVQY